MKAVADAAHGFSRVPLLTHDDRQLVVFQRRPDYLLRDKPRNGFVEVIQLLVLPFINPFGVVPADPLTPGVERKLAAAAWFVASPDGIADEEEVGSKALIG